MISLGTKTYPLALEALAKVGVNHLFARFVAEQKVTGTIYGNHALNPDTFHIVHPYGMSLLFGNASHEDFNQLLKEYLLNTTGIRRRIEWLQAYPSVWNKRIETMLGEHLTNIHDETGTSKKVEEHTRVNFRFNPAIYKTTRQELGKCAYPIVPTNPELFERMNGSVVPRYFWDSAEDFSKNGKGFSLVDGNSPVATAYSAYIFMGLLELGIETSAGYRGKGLALHACSALIDYCLEHKYEPIWSCRLENTGSYNLALKLGFEPTFTLPYYKLPV